MEETTEQVTQQFEQNCTLNSCNQQYSADSGSLLWMSPRDILFTQDSIKCTFTDDRTTLEQTFRQQLNGESTVADIEPIEVVEDEDGRWWAISGNRRLFIYKILERFDIIGEICVKILDINDDVTRRLFRKRHTTTTGGTSIRVRDRPLLEKTLENLAKDIQTKRIKERTVRSKSNETNTPSCLMLFSNDNTNVTDFSPCIDIDNSTLKLVTYKRLFRPNYLCTLRTVVCILQAVDDIRSVLKLLPSDILYSQDSINSRFTDGTTLEQTYRQLLYQEVTESDIEPIEVVKDERGRWWVVSGNRRLFLYKILYRFHLIHEITVKVKADVLQQRNPEKFTTDTEGTSVRVRKHPELEKKLEKLSKQFRDERVEELVITNAEHSPVEYLDYQYSEYDEYFDNY